MEIAVEPARTVEDYTVAVELVREYVASLGLDLSFQGYASELTDLARRYARP